MINIQFAKKSEISPMCPIEHCWNDPRVSFWDMTALVERVYT